MVAFSKVKQKIKMHIKYLTLINDFWENLLIIRLNVPFIINIFGMRFMLIPIFFFF